MLFSFDRSCVVIFCNKVFLYSVLLLCNFVLWSIGAVWSFVELCYCTTDCCLRMNTSTVQFSVIFCVVWHCFVFCDIVLCFVKFWLVLFVLCYIVVSVVLQCAKCWCLQCGFLVFCPASHGSTCPHVKSNFLLLLIFSIFLSSSLWYVPFDVFPIDLYLSHDPNQISNFVFKFNSQHKSTPSLCTVMISSTAFAVF